MIGHIAWWMWVLICLAAALALIGRRGDDK